MSLAAHEAHLIVLQLQEAPAFENVRRVHPYRGRHPLLAPRGPVCEVVAHERVDARVERARVLLHLLLAVE